MFVFFSRYKNVITFVCLCTISLILSWSTVTTESTAYASNSLKHRLSAFLAPIHFCSSVISAIWARVAYLVSMLVSIFQKPVEKAQLQNLKSEVENLKYQLDMEKDRSKRLEELYEVYTDLTGGSGSEPDRRTGDVPGRPYRLVPAKVIAVEPTEWFRYLTIDKGRKDNVDVDMAVITRFDSEADAVDTPDLTGAVVGKIVDVQWHSARVQLITDRLSVVAVTIESLGDLVLLRGQPETENCAIDEIPSTAHDRLRKGDVVIVDERSSIFPPGMLVGKISSIREGIRFCPIEVQPAFKFSKLREVMVVLDTGC